ncbi:MAG: flagellar hook-length control protein FliK [Clostridiales bacterium]|nr:flagellar hook-length control protein FliK [Clostridiales bacterium]
MQIKTIKTQNGLSGGQNQYQNLQALKKGDVVVAEILAQKGEVLTLKKQDNFIFTAKILSEMQLTIGEHVELLVEDKIGKHYIMKVTTETQSAIELTSETTAQAPVSKSEAKITGLLNNLGIEFSNHDVENIATVMKDIPRLDVKTAVFMTINKLPITLENIEIVKQFVTNDNISQNLLEILEHVALETSPHVDAHLNEQLQNEKTSQLIGQSDQTVRSDSNQAMRSDGNKSVLQENALNQNINHSAIKLDSELSAAVQKAYVNGEAMVAQEHVATEDIINLSKNEPVKAVVDQFLQKDSAKHGVEKQLNTLLSKSDASHEGINPKDVAMLKIASKVMSIFTNIEDVKKGQIDIKKEAEDVPRKLVELKETIKTTDLKNSKTIIDKADKVILQNKMTQDVNRFTFLHIPFNLNNAKQTAELFIFRNNKSKKNKEDDQTRILIGLDTQNLGRFEAMIQAHQKNLSIVFSQENDRAQEVIKLRAKGLEAKLSKMGYTLSEVKVERLLERTTVVNAEEAIKNNISSSSSFIDYKI